MSDIMRCPFVRAIAEGREDEARTMAALPPEPAEPVVVDWLVAEAGRQITEIRGDGWSISVLGNTDRIIG